MDANTGKQEDGSILSPYVNNGGEPVITDDDRELDFARDRRVYPVVKRLIEILYERRNDLPVGLPPKGMSAAEWSQKQSKEYMLPVAEEIIKSMIANGLMVDEVNYAMRVSIQAIELPMAAADSIVKEQFEQQAKVIQDEFHARQKELRDETKRKMAEFYGHPDVESVTVGDIERKIRENE